MDIPSTFHRFTELPAELRVRIYELAFSYPLPSPRTTALQYSQHRFALLGAGRDYIDEPGFFVNDYQTFAYLLIPASGMPSARMLHICQETREIALQKHGMFMAKISGAAVVDSNEYSHLETQDKPRFRMVEKEPLFWTSSKDLVLLGLPSLSGFSEDGEESVMTNKYLVASGLKTTFYGIKYLALDVRILWDSREWEVLLENERITFLELDVLFLLTSAAREGDDLEQPETLEAQEALGWHQWAYKWLKGDRNQMFIDLWDVKKICFVPTPESSQQDALSLIHHWENEDTDNDLPTHKLISS
jgi:hypothetical protein